MIYSVPLKTATTLDSTLIPLAVAKNFIRVDTADNREDTRITNLIKASRQEIENRINRIVLTSTWTLNIDNFPLSTIQIPKTPIQSVSSVKYYNAATPTVLTTLTENTHYRVDINTGRISPMSGTTWPSTKSDTYNAVQVEFVAGYTVANVPPGIKNGILYKLWENYHGDPMEKLIEAATGFYRNQVF